jgi:hypothetical protein
MSLLNRVRLLAEDFSRYRRTIDAKQKAEVLLSRHIKAQLATMSDLRSLPRRRSGRTLVMGLTVGYGEAELAPFVESLRTCGYEDDATPVTFDTNIVTSIYLKSWSVQELSFGSLPFLPVSMNSARMLKFLEFLRNEVLSAGGAHRYDYILSADVRDIVFQGNPFARVDGADVYYYLEADRIIGDCPINSRWMEQAFGPEVRLSSASHRISCAGMLIATSLGLMEYLLQDGAVYLPKPPKCPAVEHRSGDFIRAESGPWLDCVASVASGPRARLQHRLQGKDTMSQSRLDPLFRSTVWGAWQRSDRSRHCHCQPGPGVQRTQCRPAAFRRSRERNDRIGGGVRSAGTPHAGL